MNACVGIKTDGVVCGKRCNNFGDRCATHVKTLNNNGPNETARRELGYIHKALEKTLVQDVEDGLIGADNETKIRVRTDLSFALEQMRLTHRRDMHLLERQQEDEIRATGIDPDARARERRLAAQDVRRRQREQREQMEIALHEDLDRWHPGNRERLRIVNVLPPIGELAQFANDNQNVHTTSAVMQTKEMVNRILLIKVPTEYSWNMSVCSKTPGDIIMTCKITPKSSWMMISKYCQDESIYEIGNGIYGRVLDGVWQYIVNSPDKEDLCKILKQEMEDNIGMCAQGNLTRLCNILSGYMEGIGVQESPSEILGRRLPMLMEISDQTERLKKAFELFIELKIPESQWLAWAEPLADDVILIVNTDASGEVIGIATSA